MRSVVIVVLFQVLHNLTWFALEKEVRSLQCELSHQNTRHAREKKYLDGGENEMVATTKWQRPARSRKRVGVDDK